MHLLASYTSRFGTFHNPLLAGPRKSRRRLLSIHITFANATNCKKVNGKLVLKFMSYVNFSRICREKSLKILLWNNMALHFSKLKNFQLYAFDKKCCIHNKKTYIVDLRARTTPKIQIMVESELTYINLRDSWLPQLYICF